MNAQQKRHALCIRAQLGIHLDKIKPVDSKQLYIAELARYKLLYSYITCIGFKRDNVWYLTLEKFSLTTTRQTSQFINSCHRSGINSTRLNEAEFLEGFNSILNEHRLTQRVEHTAQQARDAGQRVEIDLTLPTVLVQRGADDEFFFQEYEASALLDEVPEFLNAEDYILYVAQGW